MSQGFAFNHYDFSLDKADVAIVSEKMKTQQVYIAFTTRKKVIFGTVETQHSQTARYYA